MTARRKPLTPRMAVELNRIIDAGPDGLPLADAHRATAVGLEQRGLVEAFAVETSSRPVYRVRATPEALEGVRQ